MLFCFTQQTKWSYRVRSVTDSMAGVSSRTALVSCLHKNVKSHRINTTDMLHPRLECPLRAPCLRPSVRPRLRKTRDLSPRAEDRSLWVSRTPNARRSPLARWAEWGSRLPLFCKQGDWGFPFQEASRRVSHGTEAGSCPRPSGPESLIG